MVSAPQSPRPSDPLGTGKHTNPPAGLQLTVPDDVLAGLAERAAAIVVEQLATEAEPWLDVAGAAAHLACGKSRIYALVSAERIPVHRDGSRLLFRRTELDEWVRAGGERRP